MKKSALLLLAAWLIHAVAWFLPAITAHDFESPVPGWLAFRYSSCGLLPCQGIQFDSWFHAALSTISMLTTLFFVLWSPWAILRASPFVRRLTACIAAAAFLFNPTGYFFLVLKGGNSVSPTTCGGFPSFSSPSASSCPATHNPTRSRAFSSPALSAQAAPR